MILHARVEYINVSIAAVFVKFFCKVWVLRAFREGLEIFRTKKIGLLNIDMLIILKKSISFHLI